MVEVIIYTAMSICYVSKGRAIYKNNGVCLIEDIRPLAFGTTQRNYYIMRPLNNNGTVHVPVEKE